MKVFKFNTDFEKFRKIVVKVGTSTLTHDTGMVNLRKMELLVKVLSDLENSGKKIILVSSGAVSAGFTKIGFTSRPKETAQKQASAAVGQCELMNMYDRLFSQYGHKIAQVLLTKDALDNPERRKNCANTFEVLLNMNCIPVVNENDTVSSVEIEFGGNDTLSAYVATITEADLIINLSDVDGFFDSDPRKDPNARLIPLVTHINEEISSAASSAGTVRGTGGMIAKLKAAGIAAEAGIPMIIANGVNPDILYNITEGTFRGTMFTCENITAEEKELEH
ncbi:MAG: glutamate 5-kinase [Clostridia bacterium]|nr:glutamate 5-kinase [Clostridia bacterium]